MTTRKTPRTAQIKPATRNAIMDQLAVAADEIVTNRSEILMLRGFVAAYEEYHAGIQPFLRPWWHRLMWWRA